MEPVDRLAALLDGELSPDETAALRAEIARRGELADLLAALRRADAALHDVPPTPEPDGFEARLAARLAPEIAATIGAPAAPTAPADGAAAAPTPLPRRRPRWVPAVSGAAAGLLVLGGTAVVLLTGPVGGDDDAATMLAEDRDEAVIDAPEMERATPDVDGPVVVTGDRDLDPAAADDLLAAPALQAVTDRLLDPAGGRELASRWRDDLDATEALAAPEAMLEAAPDSGTDDAMDEEAAEAPSVAGDASEDSAPATGDEDQADAGDDAAGAAEPDEVALLRCLDVVLASDPDAIPVYLEVARFEGEPALVYGLVTVDPATGAYTRPEVWVVDRVTCEPRRFTQGAGG